MIIMFTILLHQITSNPKISSILYCADTYAQCHCNDIYRFRHTMQPKKVETVIIN